MNAKDWCDPDAGFSYLFARMSAVYGAQFSRNWADADPALVRETWKEVLGRFLTYRPSMDYGLAHMHPDRPPSALAFRDLCLRGPALPRPGQRVLEHNGAPQKPADPEARRKAIEALRVLRDKLAIKSKFEIEK